MPKAIILYEIDSSFGPNILAEYYVKQGEKIPAPILKEFAEKHAKKSFIDVTILKENDRYFSSKVDAESLNKENLYLSFILQEGEDLVSLKSVFKNVEKTILPKFTSDRKQLTDILKNALNSILSLIQKLKEPKIIKETINERTKILLDQGKLQEARELIDLGEDIPKKMAAEVQLADQLLNDKLYKKAKKSFIKAAELASTIQEVEIASFLENKAIQVGLFPDLIKERENLQKEVDKIVNNLDSNELYLYNDLIEPIERLIEISVNFEQSEMIDHLTNLRQYIQRASRLAKELYGLDEKIKEMLEKI